MCLIGNEFIENIRYAIKSAFSGWECNNGSPSVCDWSAVQCNYDKIIVGFGVANSEKEHLHSCAIPSSICKLLIRLLQDVIYKIFVQSVSKMLLKQK